MREAEKLTIWAWYSDAPHGGYLFFGNPNPDMPPYHLGGLENLVCGEWLVWAHTRHTLEMDLRIEEWNHHPRTMKVRPRLITIELRPADAVTRSRRKRKEGGAK